MNENNNSNNPEMDYFMNEELCDVVFVVDEQRIPAPKQVLSVKSRVFRAMFSGNISEREDKVILIRDTTVEAFKTFIRFLISDQLVFSDDNDFELIGQVLRLSDKYEVCRLSKKIKDFIKPQSNLFVRIIYALVETSQTNTQMNYNTSYPEMDYLMDEDLCDVVFFVDEHRIPAPKQVLSVKSRVFRAMFSGNFIESEDKVIVIEDTTVEAFKTFVKYLVCNQTVWPTVCDDNQFELFGQLFRLSDKYEVFRLSNKIIEYVQGQICSRNFKAVSRLVFDYQIEQLMPLFIHLVENNINEIIDINIDELTEINECTQNILLDVLTSDSVYKDYDYVTYKIENKCVYLHRVILHKANFGRKKTKKQNIEGSFEAFKVLIGFLYFERLIIKDRNDIKLIHEVCIMAERYSVNRLLDEISADLKNRITFENLKQISVIILNFQITELMEKVIEFIQLNIKELIQRDVTKLASKVSSDLELIRNICKIVELYNISIGLKEKIADILKNWITFDNLVIIYKIAVDYKIQELFTNIKTFISQNRRQLSGRDEEDLIEMNNLLNNTLLLVLAKN